MFGRMFGRPVQHTVDSRPSLHTWIAKFGLDVLGIRPWVSPPDEAPSFADLVGTNTAAFESSRPGLPAA
jgi:hypothetical protein